ncbi:MULTISPECIES: restriction endonuclease subunit S [unclassified Salegentibacter]|uniref:restriction endonuclease subunit S n=1 Tax=unclassified Salegentibacter TaxID=2633436 RepID=UPI001AAE6691|nr:MULTISPECIES: restriction endonuclease subunit S [unclassified Salegentibacter]MBO2545287.1 restriction endonuclease subunit S [Salegentibacter sp. BDJ18]
MPSNYRPIGDYIQLVDERNKELKVTTLLGLSISKEFIPSVANTVGTNMRNYKIIRENQFACSIMQVRRDGKMPVALLEDIEEAIISQAYPVFEIIDTEVLLPQYLMMWFSRSEFDRQATFHAVGGVRGSLEWEDFLAFELPVPSIEKQREIVKEYNVVKNRIKLNEEINQKLEETAQALYKHWFVDFEFPNKKGKPYKSSGGEMVYNEELDKEIPEGWIAGSIDEICDIEDGDRGKNYPKKEEFSNDGYCLFLNAGNVTKSGFDFSNNSFVTKEKDELLRKGKLKRKDVVMTTRGTVGNIGYYNDKLDFENVRINSGMVILRNPRISFFLYTKMKSAEMKDLIINHLSGSAQPQLPITDIKRMKFPMPGNQNNLTENFNSKVTPLQNSIDDKNLQIRYLNQLQNLLLSRIARVKQEKISLAYE